MALRPFFYICSSDGDAYDGLLISVNK